MLELWQTECCPASRHMRERPTEPGIDYLTRQVPVERELRTAVRQATGSDTIPALVLEDGTVVIGEAAIRHHFDEQMVEPPEAEAHRQKAAKARRRYLEEVMRMLATGYTVSATTEHDVAEAVERVRDELNTEGFGVLCEIDVQATLKQKLGIEREPYLILGACNPPLAHRALEAEPELGALLPCNVVVYVGDGETHIAAVEPERMLSIVDNPDLAPIAADVRERLASVVERAARP